MSTIQPLNHFFKELQVLIQSHEFQHRHLLHPNAFSRNRKLTLEHIISFLLSLPKKSLVTELELLFENMEQTPLREIKFPLESGEIEMLVTNLFQISLQIKDFKELYFLRWGIETKYGELKNRLLTEKFCGKKPECILQEFYAHLFVSNIVAVMKKYNDEKIKQEQKKKGLKWKYQTNQSYLSGLVTLWRPISKNI